MKKCEEATIKIMRLAEQIKEIFDEYEPDSKSIMISISRSKKRGDNISVCDALDEDENHYIDGFRYGDYRYRICDRYFDFDELNEYERGADL